MTQNLYLFVGRSGTGKTSITKEVCQRMNMTYVSSYTDRAQRYENEKGHIFLSTENFNKLYPKIAYVKFDGHQYCTTPDILNKSDCYVIEPKGILDMKRAYTGRPIVVIGLYVPMREIINRMRIRGDSEESIKIRLDNDELIFGMMDDLCDAIFVNRDKETTIKDICTFISRRENNR